MVRIENIATFPGVAGNNFGTIVTGTGVWGMVYSGGKATIIGPDGQVRTFDAPQLHVGRMGVVDGKLVVDYTAFLGYIPGTERDNPDRQWRRLYTDLVCGLLVGATEVVVTGPPGIGTKGDRGDRGPNGATGPQGPQGIPGRDGDMEAAQKLGNYPYQQGVTVRGQNDSIEAQVKGSRVDAAYIAEQNRQIVAKLDALTTSITALTAALTPKTTP